MARDVFNEERVRVRERFLSKIRGTSLVVVDYIGIFMNNRCLKRNFTSV